MLKKNPRSISSFDGSSAYSAVEKEGRCLVSKLLYSIEGKTVRWSFHSVSLIAYKSKVGVS